MADRDPSEGIPPLKEREDVNEISQNPTHIEYAGFLWCRESKETIGKYEDEVKCEYCDEIIEVVDGDNP